MARKSALSPVVHVGFHREQSQAVVAARVAVQSGDPAVAQVRQDPHNPLSTDDRHFSEMLSTQHGILH